MKRVDCEEKRGCGWFKDKEMAIQKSTSVDPTCLKVL
jgi:hypothetical protein